MGFAELVYRSAIGGYFTVLNIVQLTLNYIGILINGKPLEFVVNGLIKQGTTSRRIRIKKQPVKITLRVSI